MRTLTNAGVNQPLNSNLFRALYALDYNVTMHNKNMWSPWRYEYIRNLSKELDDAGQVRKPDVNSVSFIASYFQTPEKDEANLVIHRNEEGLIFLNRYPYANGHLLVALGEAKPELLAYSDEQRSTLWKLVELGASILKVKLNPQGINIGINEGEASGAGVPQHLHVHIIPRWSGDTNFMSSVGNVRVIPASLEIMWEQLTST